jgi:predicted nucleic acid-binding Zn ribbon protein
MKVHCPICGSTGEKFLKVDIKFCCASCVRVLNERKLQAEVRRQFKFKECELTPVQVRKKYATMAISFIRNFVKDDLLLQQVMRHALQMSHERLKNGDEKTYRVNV